MGPPPDLAACFGFAIIAYVLVNAEANAKIAGLCLDGGRRGAIARPAASAADERRLC